MKRITHTSKEINIARMLYKSFLIGTLATLGFTASSIVSSVKADAQTPKTVNDSEIVKYSKALLMIEQNRVQAFDEIKKLSGGKVPAIICNRPKTITSLSSREARNIAKNYCQDSQKIVRGSGLSVKRFNGITLQLRTDDSLKMQIHKALIRIQNKPSSR
ncbi:hypothetical protein NIES267_24630 [Calothrix parasitica NIES-267]|uniref:DUF4168 domain-containing protein n=1 Tax=Calothrix parasitica NIES-267 TaxID=1973488 RepID=A0A1Z4LP35_9CYAN|nr:hypothetical protein NIES267_24630 [Calothrix parasitica NIES-267]